MRTKCCSLSWKAMATNILLGVLVICCCWSNSGCEAVSLRASLAKPAVVLDNRNRNKVSVKKSIAAIVAAKKLRGVATVVDSVSASASVAPLQLDHFQTMTAGAVSRTFAQLCMHPVNTFKTILQTKGASRTLKTLSPSRLLRGADAQFVMSLPHGAIYFYVIESVRSTMADVWPKKFAFLHDFVCSSASTIVCSIVSTPQMVITDRLMAGIYPSFPDAVSTILRKEGLQGFYSGWWPALAQKIPSYGLTWMFFNQMKRGYLDYFGSQPSGDTSFGLGALAAAAAVCVMIPMDTVKTRLVLQGAAGEATYAGVRDCFYRIFREEGLGAFYISLLPRLASVVPMISIQFGAYEIIKGRFMEENREKREAERIQLQKLRQSMRSVRIRRPLKGTPNYV